MIQTKGIESITVSRLTNRKGSIDSIVISNSDQIAKIIGIVNKGSKEPTKFIANYKVAFNYFDHSTFILVNAKYFLLDGVAYAMKENLENELNQLK